MAVTPSTGAASTISPSSGSVVSVPSAPATSVVVTPGARVAPGLIAPGAVVTPGAVVAPGATVVAVVFETKKSPVIVGLLHDPSAGAAEAPGIWATAANAASTKFFGNGA